VRLREDLVQERTAHKQRLGAHLQQYAPELYALVSPFSTRWTLELMLAYPTMKRLQAAKLSELRRFARKHQVLTKQEALFALKDVTPIPVPDCLDAPHAFQVQHDARAIQELDRTVAELDRKLAELIRNHPDANIIESLPGGRAPTRGAIWSGLESDVSMCQDADELAARWSAVPVTIKSGKSRYAVRLRRACDHTQRQYMLWFSWTTSKLKDCWAHEYYQRKRDEGSRHYEALRCVARRWIRILWSLFTRKTKYDEATVRRAAHAASPA
jgi:transposase